MPSHTEMTAPLSPADMAQLPPTAGDTTQTPAAPSNDKYRFWLSFTALILSAFFGALAYLSFASGTALSGEMETVDPASTLLRFDIIGGIFIAMVPLSFFTAYRLRPGGD